ncbi:MAG: hypothetical protein H6925_04725 [Holosporaceae bacterium]|nr:MAG: hypothetical protein H6925_04725 [Holosporaceae bacterium]
MNLRLVLTIINALILPYLGWAADQDDEQHVRRERTLAWVGGMCAMAFDARLLTNEEASVRLMGYHRNSNTLAPHKTILGFGAWLAGVIVQPLRMGMARQEALLGGKMMV